MVKAENRVMRSFVKAWGMIPNIKMKPLREEIQRELNISQPTFYNRMRGKFYCTEREASKIEKAFAKHGFKNIWD